MDKKTQDSLLKQAVEIQEIVAKSPATSNLDLRLTAPAGWLNVTDEGSPVKNEKSSWFGGRIIKAEHQHKGIVPLYSGILKTLEQSFEALYPVKAKRPEFWINGKFNPASCRVEFIEGRPVAHPA